MGIGHTAGSPGGLAPPDRWAMDFRAPPADGDALRAGAPPVGAVPGPAGLRGQGMDEGGADKGAKSATASGSAASACSGPRAAGRFALRPPADRAAKCAGRRRGGKGGGASIAAALGGVGLDTGSTAAMTTTGRQSTVLKGFARNPQDAHVTAHIGPRRPLAAMGKKSVEKLSAPPRGPEAATGEHGRASSSRREAFSQSRMRDWLRQRGGLVDNVEIAMFDYPGGVRVRGCAAVRDMRGRRLGAQSGDSLRLHHRPPRCHARRGASMGVESAHDPVLARDVALAAGLLRERHLGERSAFAEFMSSLPTPAEQPDNLPRWDDAQLAVLGSVLHKFVIWRRMMLNSLLDMVSQHGALLGHHAEEDCVWALSIVVSRQVHGMLMPLLDLANHASEPNAEMQHYDGGVRQVAKRDIARGEE
ncbi:unnamed protein product, partial [Prorocentrum cordatum]